jgi:hypothetical protein
LRVEHTRVVERAAAERDLEEQLEGDEVRRDVRDARAMRAQAFADKIEIARETAIGESETTINARVL